MRTFDDPGPVLDVPPWSRDWSPSPGGTAPVDASVPVRERRTPRRRRGVVIGACAVILLVMTGAVFALNGLRDSGTEVAAPVSAAPDASTVAVPEFTAKVVRTDRGVTATAAIGLNSVRSRGVFYVVEVTVTNNGTAAVKLAYPRQRLAAYGQPFVADRTATSYLNGSPAMTIPPTGHPVVVRLAFDIPQGWHPDAMTLTLDDRANGSVELPLP